MVLVECDTGGGRCGVQSAEQAVALARHIAMSPGLRFGGLMTYPPLGKPEVADRWLGHAKADDRERGPRRSGRFSGKLTGHVDHRPDQHYRTQARYLHLFRPLTSRPKRQHFFRLRPHRSGNHRVTPHRHPYRDRRRLKVPEQRPSRAHRAWRCDGERGSGDQGTFGGARRDRTRFSTPIFRALATAFVSSPTMPAWSRTSSTTSTS